MNGTNTTDVEVAPDPSAAGECIAHVTRHTSHLARHTSSGTLSWTEHGYVARAKVEKKNRKLFAKRKVQSYIRCDFCLRHVTCAVAYPYSFAQYMGLDGEMTPTMLDIVHDIFAAAASDDDADAELVHLESDAAAAAAYDDEATADCDISNRNSPSVRVKQRKLRLDIKASDGSRCDV
jgi:hypothetical protein